MSKIEWTDETWNPTTGCTKVSAGCKNCYAEVMHKRLMSLKPEKYAHPFLDGAFAHEEDLLLPLRWKKPRMVFVNSMSDLFHENIPFYFIDRVFAMMALCPQHTFQILTKRPERMLEWYNSIEGGWSSPAMGAVDERIRYQCFHSFGRSVKSENWKWPLPNVWLGVSCENQAAADERIPLLLQVPAAVRFLSCEPLLGKIDLKLFSDDVLEWKLNNLADGNGPSKGIDWVIAGGESGHHARPMHPDWARGLRDQCVAAGVPFFFKQWGEWCPSEYVAKDFKAPASHYKWACEDGSIDESLLNGGFKNETAHHDLVVKYGKQRSGRLLDGREWNEFPKTEKLVEA